MLLSVVGVAHEMQRSGTVDPTGRVIRRFRIGKTVVEGNGFYVKKGEIERKSTAWNMSLLICIAHVLSLKSQP